MLSRWLSHIITTMLVSELILITIFLKVNSGKDLKNNNEKRYFSMYCKCFSKSVRGGHVVHEECGEITTIFVFVIHSCSLP